jgi:hypothetical protein
MHHPPAPGKGSTRTAQAVLPRRLPDGGAVTKVTSRPSMLSVTSLIASILARRRRDSNVLLPLGMPR